MRAALCNESTNVFTLVQILCSYCKPKLYTVFIALGNLNFCCWGFLQQNLVKSNNTTNWTWKRAPIHLFLQIHSWAQSSMTCLTKMFVYFRWDYLKINYRGATCIIQAWYGRKCLTWVRHCHFKSAPSASQYQKHSTI